MSSSPSHLRELMRSDHIEIRYDKQYDLVIIVRTSHPFESIASLDECFERMRMAVAGIPKHKTLLLVDTRRGILRNDPVFEARFHELRNDFWLGYSKVGVWVKTAVGKLQVMRQAKSDLREIAISMHLAELLEYLGLPPDYRIED